MVAVVENTPRAWTERAQAAESWSAAMWSENGQNARFARVLDELGLDGNPASVLDFGAGTGRFSEFLPRAVTYYAVDWADGMRDRCKAEHPRAFVLSYVPDGAPFTHVVAIGTFNLRDNWSKDQTREVIARLWDRTARSLVVSLYHGADPACLSYTIDDALSFLRLDGVRGFTVDRHMPNDLLLAVRR